MRFTAILMIVVQLLIRGMAASHSHPAEVSGESADHASRPHLHLMGHAHSHASHNHSHHRHSHDDVGSPVVPEPETPLSDSSEHDQDAVYVDGETLGMPLDRIETSNPTDVIGLVAEFVSRESETLPRLRVYGTAGPPGLGGATLLDFLPHLLRV